MCIAEIWYEQWNPKVCRDPRSWRPVTTNNSGSVQQLGEVLRKTCPPPLQQGAGARNTQSPWGKPMRVPKTAVAHNKERLRLVVRNSLFRETPVGN